MEISTLKSTVNRIAARISTLEDYRKKTSSALRSISGVPFRIGNLTDDKILNSVKSGTLNVAVGGVDGGLLTKSFHGIDLVITRAVGVLFNYKNGQVVSSKIFPQKMPFISEVNSGDEGELIVTASLYRMREELLKTVELVEASRPNYVFTDGPLYPHPSTRVAKNSHLKKLYAEVVSLYNQLNKVCEESGTQLVGIVEDSRSRYFASVLFDKIVPNLPENSRKLFSNNNVFRDTALLYDALKKGERTATFKISNIQDLQYKHQVFGFYIRTAKYDRPLRVELSSSDPGKHVSDIATLVYDLAAFPRYGLPSVLVEADLRAKLKKTYMEYIRRTLFSKSHSPLIMSLRRDNRPL
ncbi:MAG: DNA double-strand break repair nuclease NurA [Candidatus Altiarchaeota archaeon]|nr:DNA double-strand break repair nuclease NurA [Candidatus Altiarchaeota archaeon]